MGRGGAHKTASAGPRTQVHCDGRGAAKVGPDPFVVVGPDGSVFTPIWLGKLPGVASMWQLTAPALPEKAAAKKGAFSRAAKAPQVATCRRDWWTTVEPKLTRRVIELDFACAQGGRLAVAGYEKVKGWLEMRRGEVLDPGRLTDRAGENQSSEHAALRRITSAG